MNVFFPLKSVGVARIGINLLVVVIALSSGAGCSKEAGMASIETDAHGYLCLKCEGKFYTGSKVFLESKCPKCQQDSLVDVIGYKCQKDQHLTIRPKVSSPQGAAVCEQCNAQLKDAMVSPHEVDLKNWGATKTSP